LQFGDHRHASRTLSCLRIVRGTLWHRKATSMSWLVRLAPVVMVCACGGTTIVRDGDAGMGGSGATGGDVGNGGQVGSGGDVGNAGSGGAGGKLGTGGKTGTGGKSVREPMNHRPTPVACGVRPPAADAQPPQGQSPGFETCMTNTDCKSGPNGRCIGGRVGLHCTYDDCFNDNDCGKGSVCTCGGGMGDGSRCLGQGCQVDADCPGSFCSPTFGTCGNYDGVVSYQCHTPKDECLDDTDCTNMPPNVGLGYCAYDTTVGHWACSYTNCVG
jgi:hypothetical protein